MHRYLDRPTSAEKHLSAKLSDLELETRIMEALQWLLQQTDLHVDGRHLINGVEHLGKK